MKINILSEKRLKSTKYRIHACIVLFGDKTDNWNKTRSLKAAFVLRLNMYVILLTATCHRIEHQRTRGYHQCSFPRFYLAAESR